MTQFFIAALAALGVFFRRRGDTALEILALRQQVAILKRQRPRPLLNSGDRLFWTTLRHIWYRWADVLVVVKPATVVGWHRAGSKFGIVTGRGKGGHRRYGCPQNFYRDAYTNRVKERADWLEEHLLFEFQRVVLRPEIVEYALAEFQRQLTTSLSELTGQLARMRRRREDIQRELRNLVDTAARCGYSATVVEAISDCERELSEITRRLFASEPESVSSEVARIRQFVSERLGNLRKLLARGR
jgi:hypothetical protein